MERALRVPTAAVQVNCFSMVDELARGHSVIPRPTFVCADGLQAELLGFMPPSPAAEALQAGAVQ